METKAMVQRPLQRIVRLFFKPKRRRLELRFVTYRESEPLLKAGWTIAPEDDYNLHIGKVWLELLERETA